MVFKEMLLQESDINAKKIISELKIATIKFGDDVLDAYKKHLAPFKERLIKAYKDCKDEETKKELKSLLVKVEVVSAFADKLGQDFYKCKKAIK